MNLLVDLTGFVLQNSCMRVENGTLINIINCKVNHQVNINETELPRFPHEDIFRVECLQLVSARRSPNELPPFRLVSTLNPLNDFTAICEAGDCANCDPLKGF